MTKAQMIAAGMDPNKCPRRTKVQWLVAHPTRFKIFAMREFLRLPTSVVLDMGMEALIAFINQRHLANGGAEVDLLSWNSDIIDNPKFYMDAKLFWNGGYKGDSKQKRAKDLERNQHSPAQPGAGSDAQGGSGSA